MDIESLKRELDALRSKVQGNGKVEGSLEFRIIMLESNTQSIKKEIAEIKATMETSIKDLEQTIDKRMGKFETMIGRVGWTVIIAVLGAVVSNVLI